MRSSTGEHFIALDHVRALAAFSVFVWHFTHSSNGYPVPFDYVPLIFPFALLDEGHTGVAIFLTLSGYLFAKLLNGRTIYYKAFLWNRVLRLLPLLSIVVLIVGIQEYLNGTSVFNYAKSILKGMLTLTTLPQGWWSIAIEFHYYAILPIFLWMFRKSKTLPILIIMAALALRVLIYYENGGIQYLAYQTIIGRMDQFAAGMLLFQFRAYLAGRHAIATVTFLTFCLFYWYFDLRGGYYHNPSYPSPSRLWIFIPTIEAMAYAILIAWYDSSFSVSGTGVSRFWGRIGEYSYSIYLLHFFVVFDAARFVNEQIMDISNFYLASIWSFVFFLLMMIPGYLSFRFIESPFLKLRKRYIAV